MAFNSYKKDENTVTAGKAATLSRLFSYLLSYKKQIVGVLFRLLPLLRRSRIAAQHVGGDSPPPLLLHGAGAGFV